MKKLKKLITLALKDGKISDKERELILKKASNLGIDEIEAEMVLEGMISDHENGIKKTEKPVEINPDGYSIEDAELIMRTTKWVDRCSENNIKTKVLEFPKLIADESNFMKKLDGALDVTGNIASKIAKTGIGGALKFVPGLGGVIGGVISNISDSTSLVDLDNKEIRELAKQYLMILELRSSKNTILANKFTELNAKYEEQIKTYNNKGFFKKLF
jgi:hypothetical protein